jgi:hypothetical protein
MVVMKKTYNNRGGDLELVKDDGARFAVSHFLLCACFAFSALLREPPILTQTTQQHHINPSIHQTGDDSAFALYMRGAATAAAAANKRSSAVLEPSPESVLYLEGKKAEFEKVAAACQECRKAVRKQQPSSAAEEAAVAPVPRRRRGGWWRTALSCVLCLGPAAEVDADRYWESYAPADTVASAALSSSSSALNDPWHDLESSDAVVIAAPASCADSVEFFDTCSALGSSGTTGSLLSAYGSAVSTFSSAQVAPLTAGAQVAASSGRLSGQLLSGALSAKRSVAAAARASATAAAAAAANPTAVPCGSKPVTRGLAPAEPLLMADREYELVPMPEVTGFAGYWAKDASRSSPFPLPTDELFRSSLLQRAAHESINGAFFQDARAAITFTAKAEAIPAGPLARYAEVFSKEHGAKGTWRLRRDLVLTGRTEGRAYFTACGTLILRTAAYNAFAAKPCQIMEDYVTLSDDGKGLVLRMCALDVATGRSATQFFVCSYAGDKPPRGW